jgi:hypothetical protein
MKLEISRQFPKNPEISNFTKISPFGAELFPQKKIFSSVIIHSTEARCLEIREYQIAVFVGFCTGQKEP